MRLSVTTPRGALVDTEVDEVTATGELGEFGVLPGHVPLMSALKAGVLWYKGKDHSGVLALGQGFLQVAPMPQADDHKGLAHHRRHRELVGADGREVYQNGFDGVDGGARVHGYESSFLRAARSNIDWVRQNTFKVYRHRVSTDPAGAVHAPRTSSLALFRRGCA